MKINLLWLSAALFLVSCGENDKGSADKKETPSATNTSTSNDGDGNEIRFKAGDDKINSEGWVVQRFVWDDKTEKPWLNIVSNMHKDKRSINVNLNGASPGTYNFVEANSSFMKNSHGTYFPDYSDALNSYSFISGAFTITEVDTVQGIVNGTFSGVVKSNDGKTITITDGQLNKLRLKSGVTNLAKGFDAIK
jgi:hypothetical protein